jgi:alpha-galactosidase
VATGPAPLCLPGLDPEAVYEVRVAGRLPAGVALPEWTAAPVRLRGSVLAELGLPSPALKPATALVIELELVR